MPVIRADVSAAALRRRSSELGLLFDQVPGITLIDGDDGNALIIVDPTNPPEAVQLMNRLIRFGLAKPA